MGKILLYYKYTDIQDPAEIQAWQKELCSKLNLKGRIILAHEGINGTVGGSSEEIESYQEAMRAHPLFYDVDFKISDGGAYCFPRMKIVIKNEIVRLGIDPTVVRADQAGVRLSPQEAHELIAQKRDDLVILDTRNTYEAAIGTFEGAVIPPIENFRDLPAYIDNNQALFAGKKVLMFCTGGVRCERASAYLKMKDIAQEVYHINGGICRYVEQYPEGYFKGSNYVFDGRVTVKINAETVGKCLFCGALHDLCSNCVNTRCNERIISCDSCTLKYVGTCSQSCAELVKSHQVTVRTVPTYTVLPSSKTQEAF